MKGNCFKFWILWTFQFDSRNFSLTPRNISLTPPEYQFDPRNFCLTPRISFPWTSSFDPRTNHTDPLDGHFETLLTPWTNISRHCWDPLDGHLRHCWPPPPPLDGHLRHCWPPGRTFWDIVETPWTDICDPPGRTFETLLTPWTSIFDPPDKPYRHPPPPPHPMYGLKLE